MKKNIKVFSFFLIVCLALCLAACGMNGNKNDTKLYVPRGDTGGYQETERIEKTENQSGSQNQSAEQPEQKTMQEDDKSMQDGGESEKPEVGRFDLKSLKAGDKEIKDEFEYFYIQLRADDVLIASAKQKDKKEAYLTSGYKKEDERIVFDNRLDEALSDLSIQYKGKEIKVAFKDVEAIFLRSDTK